MTAIVESILFLQTIIQKIHAALNAVSQIQCKTTMQTLHMLDLRATTTVIDALCRTNDIDRKSECVQIAFKNLQSILVVIHDTLETVSLISDQHKLKYFHGYRSIDNTQYLENLILNSELLHKRFALFATLYQINK